MIYRSNYQAKLDSLNVALKAANSKNDVDTAVEILETKNKTEKSLEEVEKVTKKAVATPIAIATKKDSIIVQKANDCDSKGQRYSCQTLSTKSTNSYTC